MARLIDADKLEKSLQLSIASWSRDCNSNAPVIVRTYKDVLERLKNAQTVDAVEVVRCKDCKHYKPQSKSAHWNNKAPYCCRQTVVKVNPDGFCSYGERKDNG